MYFLGLHNARLLCAYASMKPSECRGLALFQPHMHRLVRVGMQEPLILVRLYAGIIYVWDVLVF